MAFTEFKSAKSSQWVKAWKQDYVTLMPVAVEIMLIDDQWVLERGATNTSYIGGYYNSPADVFIEAFSVQAREEARVASSRNRLDRAHKRYLTENKWVA